MKEKVIKLIIEALAEFFTRLENVLGNVDAEHVELEPVAAPAPVHMPPYESDAPDPVAAPVATPAPVAAPAPVAEIDPPAFLQPAAVVAGPVVHIAAPAPVAAPAPLAAPAPAPVAGVELDSEGLPWDQRIHSGGKTKYQRKAANGCPADSWKLKKGVDPVTVGQIKTELRGRYPLAAPVATAAVTAPVVAHTTPGQVATAAPTAPAAAPTLEYGTIVTWGDFMRQVVTNGLDKTVVDAKCQEFGVANIAELQSSPNLIPTIAAQIGLTK